MGNDQILCGNVASTYYLVTTMKDPTRALRTGIPYVICSANSSLGTCGSTFYWYGNVDFTDAAVLGTSGGGRRT